MVSSLETQCLTYIAEHGPYIGLGNSLAAGDLFQDLRDMLCPALTTVSSQFWSKWFYNTLNNPTEALIPFTSRTQSQVFDLSAWEGLPLADTLQRLCSSDINQKAMAIGEIASPYLTSLVFDKSTTQHAFAQIAYMELVKSTRIDKILLQWVRKDDVWVVEFLKRWLDETQSSPETLVLRKIRDISYLDVLAGSCKSIRRLEIIDIYNYSTVSKLSESLELVSLMLDGCSEEFVVSLLGLNRSSLVKLNIESVRLQNDNVVPIRIKGLKKLSSISIDGSTCTETQFQELVNALKYKEIELMSLSNSSNFIMDFNCFTALKKCQLVSIFDGAAAFERSFSSNFGKSNVETLNLSANPIGSTICSLLLNNCPSSLRELNLMNTLLLSPKPAGVQAFEYFMEYLIAKDQLTSMNLSLNRIGLSPRAITFCCKLLRKCKSLRILYLDGNLLSKDTFLQLHESIRERNTEEFAVFQKLSVNQNKFTASDLDDVNLLPCVALDQMTNTAIQDGIQGTSWAEKAYYDQLHPSIADNLL